MCALEYQPPPPQKHSLLFFAKPSLKSANYPAPRFFRQFVNPHNIQIFHPLLHPVF